MASSAKADNSWTIVEAPAAVVLTAAFAGLCEAGAGARGVAARAALGPVFREILREGGWYSPAAAAVQAFVRTLAASVSGTAYLDLQHGECRVERVEADRAAPVSVIAKRVEALRLAEAFRASVIDASTEHFIFEITGKQSKIEQFIVLMQPLGLVEVSRTGFAAISRGADRM